MYIATGSFIIRGKRNHITPTRMELGFTLMLALADESVPNHLGERKPRLADEEMVKIDEKDLGGGIDKDEEIVRENINVV